MNRFALTAGLAAAATLSGCAQMVLLGYLIGGPPSIEPDFDAMTGESLSAPGVTAAVVCYAPRELKWDFEAIDTEVARAVTYRLGQNHVQVINPDTIRGWLAAHPDWERADEIAEAFKCDYVVEVELHAFSLLEENSTELLRGRCEATVNVTKVDFDKPDEEDRDTWTAFDGERVYSKDLDNVWPTRVPRSTHDQPFDSFKTEYLSRLSESIGWLFYEHYNGDKIPWAT